MMNSSISCLMTVYNGEKYLRDAVDSVLNQTYSDFDFVIVDDGSADSTAEILSSYKDSRIKIVNEGRLGRVGALNRGFKAVKGDLIFLMDADDMSAKDRFELQLNEYFNNGMPDVLGTAFQMLNDNALSKVVSLPTRHEDIVTDYENTRFPILHSTCLLKKESVMAIGGYDPFYKDGLAEDQDLLFRLSHNHKLQNMNKPLYLYRRHITNVTNTYTLKNRGSSVWWDAVARQRYFLTKYELDYVWEDKSLRDVLLDELSKRLEKVRYYEQDILRIKRDQALFYLNKKGMRLRGLYIVLGMLKYPVGLLIKLKYRKGKRWLPKYLNAQEVIDNIIHNNCSR